MKIKQATLEEEKKELDQLLWEVLWQPINLPRQIRKSLQLSEPQINLIAIDDDTIVGALVANWLSEDDVEIRHIAVKPNYQRHAIGTLLVEELIKLVQTKAPLHIQTYARNTSIGFFTKLGFMSKGNYLEHQDFARYGITFQRMYMEVLPVNSQ